jgi:undecaprenyl-diphosphatase
MRKELIFGFICLLLFLVLAFEIKFGVSFRQIDLIINDNVAYLRTPAFDNLFVTATIFLNVANIIIFLLILMGFLIYEGKKKIAVLSFVFLSFGLMLESFFKVLINRPRPIEQLLFTEGFGFPSGHSTLAILFFSMLIFVYIIKIKSDIIKISLIVLSALIVILTGFSRIYLNVHWFSDVLGGYLLGFSIFMFYIYIFKKDKLRC